MYIGVDLGGTNIACGLVDDCGKILLKKSTPTLASREADEITADIIELIKTVIKDGGVSEDDIKSIGVGCPGAVDDNSGIVVNCNNVKMVQYPLCEKINTELSVPVHLINDADAAAFGEYLINGNGAKSFIFVTLGTGVGGGIILNGQLLNGFNGAGGEIGHISMVYNGEDCSCGRKGCWEAYASVTALIRQTKRAMEENPDSIMHDLAKLEGKISGRTAFDAAKKGDKAAQNVVSRYLEYVADGIVSMINIFQPEKLVIGGGISKEGDYILKPVTEYVRKYEYNQQLERAKIEMATLFNDAGIIGAALFKKD